MTFGGQPITDGKYLTIPAARVEKSGGGFVATVELTMLNADGWEPFWQKVRTSMIAEIEHRAGRWEDDGGHCWEAHQ